MTTDERSPLAAVFLPYFTMRCLLDSPKNGLGTDCDVKDHPGLVMNTIYDLLQADSEEFKASFPDYKSFHTGFDALSDQIDKLFSKREAFYQKDVDEVVKGLAAIQDKMPDLDPSKLGTFISAVKRVEKKFCDLVDRAAEVMTAMEKDSEAFGCDVKTVCSLWVDSWLRLPVKVRVRSELQSLHKS